MTQSEVCSHRQTLERLNKQSSNESLQNVKENEGKHDWDECSEGRVGGNELSWLTGRLAQHYVVIFCYAISRINHFPCSAPQRG